MTATNLQALPPEILPQEVQWFYEEQGKRIGGVSEAQIIQMIKSGKLTHGSSVWKKGFADWKRLEETDLRSFIDDVAPPPLRGAHVRNSVVWVLAFAPLIGSFLEYLFAQAINSNSYVAERAYGEGNYWFISLLLNVVLSLWDARQLKAAGTDTQQFGRWALVVPVYLFQRAKALKQNLAYFIVWVVCFVLVFAAA